MIIRIAFVQLIPGKSIEDNLAIGKKACVEEMWLTHFSPSLVAPKRYMKDVNSIYSKVSLGYDGRMKTLDFVD
jgi:ribonuclease BN (tRNA processing enzyme)